MGVYYRGSLPGKEAEFGKLEDGRASRAWLFYTTNRYVEEAEILAYGIGIGVIPIPYTSFLGTSPSLLCRKLRCKQEKDSPQHWIVDAEFSSQPLDQKEKDKNEQVNPLSRRVAIKWSSSKYNKPLHQDLYGQAIVNSAGDYFDPGVEVDRSRWTASISKNVPQVPAFILDYTDAVNETAFTIQGLVVEAKVAKIMAIEISDVKTEQVGDNEIEYYEFSYTLEFRPGDVDGNDTWDPIRILDAGLRDDAGNAFQVNGKDVSSPVPMDGLGERLTSPGPDTAQYQLFHVYPLRQFGNVLPGLT